MSTTPLAEVYEQLKELRRRGDEPTLQRQSQIVGDLGATYPDVLTLSNPGNAFLAFLQRLIPRRTSDPFANVIRTLEIKTVADRVFGDEAKADAWLHRANPSLSGQKPIDLVKDELGTAVVREALERIDHGIFA
jgi:hypothetical protein